MKRMLLALAVLLASVSVQAHFYPSSKVFQKIKDNTLIVTTDYTMGNGIILEDGKVLTVAHLIGDKVVLSRPRTVLRTNPLYDLTLLDVPEAKGKTKLGPQAEVMDEVFLVGFTPGLKGTIFTTGYVVLVNGADIVVDMPDYPGNSGAGVYNTKGELIGLVKGIVVLCPDYCRPLALVRGSSVIKVFLEQGE